MWVQKKQSCSDIKKKEKRKDGYNKEREEYEKRKEINGLQRGKLKEKKNKHTHKKNKKKTEEI